MGSLLGGAAGGAAITIVIQAIDKVTPVMQGINKNMLALGGAITAAGVAGVGIIGGLIKMAGEFEQTNIAFTTMLGNAEDAKKLLNELAEFASKTPFTITGIESSAKQLLAMGIEVDNLLPTLKSLGDIAAGLNVPLDRLALNFGQVKIQGKLTGRELRDFAIAGVPLVAELSKNLGVSEQAIGEMVSKGEIGFADVEKAFTTMTSEGGKFFDLMDSQSKTFLGQVSNIQDSFIRVARVMGTVFLPTAKWVAKHLAVIVGWFEEHPKVATFAGVLLGVATALALIGGPLIMMIAIIPAFVAGLIAIAGGLTAVSIAGLPMWGVLLIIAAAIAALIAIGWLLYSNWNEIVAFMQKHFAPEIELFKLVLTSLGIAFSLLWGNFIKPVWDNFQEFIVWITDVAGPIIDGMISAIGKAIDAVSRVFNAVGNVRSGIASTISSANIKLQGSKQLGGVIPTTGSYFMQKGEMVIPQGHSSGKNITVNITGNIYGTDPDDISEAIMKNLRRKVSI